jgi:hypothetical protein
MIVRERPPETLSPTEARFYAALASGEDVDFEALVGLLGSPRRTADRRAQQILGPYITRLNRKLAKHFPLQAVRPGEKRHSYRLITLESNF